MSHDTARLSALVDGELDHEARDRLLAHVAQCAECRTIVEYERTVRGMLREMTERRSELEPSDRLVTSLVQLGGAGLPPALPATSRASAARPSALRPTTERPSSMRPGAVPVQAPPTRAGWSRRWLTNSMIGAASTVGLTAMLAFTVSGDSGAPLAETEVVPPLQQFTVEHVGDRLPQGPRWGTSVVDELLAPAPLPSSLPAASEPVNRPFELIGRFSPGAALQ